MQNIPRKILFLISAILLTGCAMPDRAGYSLEAALKDIPSSWEGSLEQSTEIAGTLKSLSDDAALVAYVDQVLENNISLKQSVLDQQIAVLQTRAANAKRLPQLNASGSAGRERQKDLGARAASTADAYGVAAALNWEVDLWGKLADQADAAEATALVSEYELKAARVSLAAQAMRDWLQLSLEVQLQELDQSRISSLRRNEQVITERFASGMGDLGDLEAARTATANAEATLISRQLRMDQLRLRMQVAADRWPAATIPSISQVPTINLPAGDLPATVLGKRPDVLAAFHRAVAADKQFSATYKEILPSFSIDLSVGDQAPGLVDLFSGGPAWRAIGSIAAPIMDGGARRLTAKQADLIAGRTWLAYRDAVLGALLDVENGLQTEQVLTRQEAVLERAAEHANNNYDQFKRRYANGLADIVTLLVAERSAFAARSALLVSKNQRGQNRIDLAVALGAGL